MLDLPQTLFGRPIVYKDFGPLPDVALGSLDDMTQEQLADVLRNLNAEQRGEPTD